jgi:hypothetical protein
VTATADGAPQHIRTLRVVTPQGQQLAELPVTQS